MTKILVIEDETILREELMLWLEMEGYEAVGAGDGKEGLILAHQFMPDLILCDIGLPQLSGYEVISDIRADVHTQLIPFIYITAKTSHEDIRQGMSLGADDYITKPFSRLELLEAVQTRTEKKALEEEYYQSNAAQWQQAFQDEHEQRMFKSKMIAMFSHDFRHPLASIMGANGMLLKYGERLDEERRIKHYRRIEASVQQLVQMLDDLLVLSQLETGSLDFKPAPLNLSKFLEQIVEEFRLANNSHSIVLDCQFSRDAMLDARLIRQIMSNLISNAIKYSPSGSEVQVSLQYLDGQIVLTIQDYGLGIPEEDQKRMFKTFQRASNVANISGTGLGLAIVQQAAQLHDGSVEIQSRTNVGTKITVRIPLL